MGKINTVNLCVYGSGIFAALLGFSTMVARYSGHEDLFRVSESFIPIAFNTALCHFLCGLSLLSARERPRWPSITLISLAAIFAAVVGSQYIFNADYGIDNLFYRQESLVRTSNPGRLAPNTVIYFLITAGSILSWHLIRKQEIRLVIVMLSGIILFLLSLIAILGYVVKVEAAYSWWGMSDMALITAIGFLAHSIGILGLAYTITDENKSQRIRFLQPVLVASLGITLTILINQSLLVRDRDQIEAVSSDQAERRAKFIGLEMQSDIQSLVRMQNRLNNAGINAGPAWVEDARNYMHDNPAYVSMAIFDTNFRLLKHVSVNQSFWQGIDLGKLASPAAKDGKDPVSLIKLPASDTQKPMLAFLMPLRRDGNFVGFLGVAYDLRAELARFPTMQDRFSDYMEITDANGLIFSNKTDRPYMWEFTHDEPISFYGLNWTVHETVTGTRPANTGLLSLISIAGIGLALLLANAIWQKDKILRYATSVRESDERIARATGAAQIGLWDWDIADDSLIWDGNAWEILGASNNDALSKKAADIFNMIHEEDRKATEDAIRAGVAGDHMFNVEYRTRRLDGKEVWIQSRGKVAVFKDDVPVRVSGTIMDITHRKLDEVELTRSNEELQRFAYVASHDLKAPLRSIDNLAKWVLEDTAEALPVDAQEKLTLLRGRVARLEALLEDILAYSRAGRIVDEAVQVNVNELVTGLIQSHVPEKFKVEIADTLPTLISPRTPLEQIFGNILTNAVKHHDKGAGSIKIDAKDRGHMIEFSVADDGPGIPPQFHARVFEMFQTLQPRDKVDGSGIGMSIIKKLVEWRGGRVWIESAEGQRGTTIRFLWPKQ